MLKIEISDTDMQQLHYERFHHLHPRVMLKMEAFCLKGLGLKNDRSWIKSVEFRQSSRIFRI
jgi:hypothetical protein